MNDEKIKEILTGKTYVKTTNDTNFVTAKGEYEIPYSELYTTTESTPSTPTEPTQTKYGLSDDGKAFIGKPANGQNGCNGNVEFADGQKFTEGHFLFVPNYDGMADPEGDAYFVWDDDDVEINTYTDCWNELGVFDIYYANGDFFTQCWGE